MANLWREFRELLPVARLIVVTVTGHNADGTSTVQTVSGSTLVVDGQDVAVNAKAFVREGRIIGEAPDLPTFEETV